MDFDEPFRYQPPQQARRYPEDQAASIASSRSSHVGPISARRSSHSGHSGSSRRANMAMYSRRPPPLREPVTFQDEIPAPPRPFHQPPPLAPYVTPEMRVHPPRVGNWGGGPDPGLEQHQRNPHPFLPTPSHSPPRKGNWRSVVNASGAEHQHPYARPSEPNLRPRPVSPNPHHVIHPPPSNRVTLPPIHDAISASSMERSWSHASEPAIPVSRMYSRSQEGSSGSRPSSNGSSGGNPSGSGGGTQSGPATQKRRRTRALMTPMQQQFLKQMWKKTKFPGNVEREQLGVTVGLTSRQVQVWFQNQRQKLRKEMNSNGIPPDADPRDWNDLDKSPRSRKLDLAAADPASKVHQWTAAQARLDETRSASSSNDPGQSTHSRHQTPALELPRHELKHLIKNPDVRPAYPGNRIHAHDDYDHHRQPQPGPSSVTPGQWSTGYRSPVPYSPVSQSAMSPLQSNTPSPTQAKFDVRGRTRHRLSTAGLSPALTGPMRSPIEPSFGDGPTPRQASTADRDFTHPSGRRRSNSLEGMRPARTPSPPDAPQKRSRTHTVASELPPSLAALALSAPIIDSPDRSRQLPRFQSDLGKPPKETYMGPPPTLPPPRGPAHERMDGHYRSHTDSTQITLQQQVHRERRLPGPGNLLRPNTDYR